MADTRTLLGEEHALLMKQWAAATPHWLDKYNPFITEAIDAHLERVLLECNGADIMCLVRDAGYMLRRRLSAGFWRALCMRHSIDDDLQTGNVIYLAPDTRVRDIDEAISQIVYHTGDVLANPMLRAKHIRAIYGRAHMLDVYGLVYNPFAAHKDVRAGLKNNAQRHRQLQDDAAGELARLAGGMNIARITLEYAWEPCAPAPFY